MDNSIDVANYDPANEVLDDLLPLLQRLDRRLEQAVATALETFGKEFTPDPYRGLHITLKDLEQTLYQPPGVPSFPNAATVTADRLTDNIPTTSRLAQLQQHFHLSDFDLEILILAIAPEIDRRYDRLYAYLHDDIRCKRPSVDLALNLLCSDAADKLTRRAHFATNAPLIHHHLLHLISDPDRSQPTLLAQEFHPDPQVVRFLLAHPGLDTRLTPFCQLTDPQQRSSQDLHLKNLFLTPQTEQTLSALVAYQSKEKLPWRLYFQGADQVGQRRAAEALATELQRPLLTVDLPRLLHQTPPIAPSLHLAFREAWFQQAILLLEGLDSLHREEHTLLYQDLMGAIAQSPSITILTGTVPWKPTTDPLGLITLPFPMPSATQRRQIWQAHLTGKEIPLSNTDLDALVDRFHLAEHQIEDAIATVSNQFRLLPTETSLSVSTNTSHPSPELLTLFAAARTQSGHGLATLACKIEPRSSWDDIVLTIDQQNQLKEICNHVKHQHLVHETWGFDRKLPLGKGLNVLFSGPPGTGKTMAAEVLAHELQLDLYKIDLSQIVSKYIGETEKNLDRIFTSATHSNAILLFDEADALFGKRSEVKDAHDRYANIEISYLLQKMEEYEGLAILTTNLRSNMDEAFVRRLRFIIEFPFPNEQHRHNIWEKVWPTTAPYEADVDIAFLARRFEITGANIRNIALAAAFLAADDGKIITMSHLIRALRREYQKMGKILMEEEFGRYAGLQ